MQRFKQRKLLFNAVLTILSISVINFSQCPSGNLCRTNASDPIFIEISSSHELGQTEVRLETHLVFLLPIKKVFHPPMNPVDGPYDRFQHDRCVFKFTDWFWGNEFLLSTHFLNSPALHMVRLEAPQSPYICVPIYLLKRHAGPPRVQFSRSLSSHGWHAVANKDLIGYSPIFSLYLTWICSSTVLLCPKFPGNRIRAGGSC